MGFTETERVAWERVPGEPARAYHGFCHYRDATPCRSIGAAWRVHRSTCQHHEGIGQTLKSRYPRSWGGWSVTWGWLERAEAYDLDLDRQARQKFADELLAAKARHVRTLQAALSVLTIAPRAILEALSNPHALARLTAKATADVNGFIAVLHLARASITGIPMIVQAERLSLGLSTEALEIEDRRESTFAARIAADPIAVELAVRLLDRIAGTAPDTPPAPRGLDGASRSVH